MQDSNHPSVVISGVGLVTSLGWGCSSTFVRLCAGEKAVVSGSWPTHSHGNQPWAGYPVVVPNRLIDRLWPDPVFNILGFAADEALVDAQINPNLWDQNRVAVVVGLSKGAVRLQSRWAENPSAMSRNIAAQKLGWAVAAPSAGASFIASRYGTGGPILAPITACATGLTAIRSAAGLLKTGSCDIAIAGAADASLEPVIHAAFARMKSLAGPAFMGESPDHWIRPWSSKRNGFLIGEGGAIFILERAEDVRRSGRTALARIDRMAAGAEAFHPTKPDDRSEVMHRVIRQVVDQDKSQIHIDAVHLHATATRGYDSLEASAVMRSLENQADHAYMLASKPQVGHCLGAAGAVELAICCESMRRGILPPFAPDSNTDFQRPGRPVGPAAIRRSVHSILKIVAGFGGHVEVCLLENAEIPA